MIKHLKPRLVPAKLLRLVRLNYNKNKYIRLQKWDKASIWRKKEENYLLKNYNLDIKDVCNYVIYAQHFPNIQYIKKMMKEKHLTKF